MPLPQPGRTSPSRFAFIAFATALCCCTAQRVRAQSRDCSSSGSTTEEAQPAPASTPAPDAPSPTGVEQPAQPQKPFTSRAWGVTRESEPPGYVKPLSTRGIPGFEDVDWLDFGFEQMFRYEMRDDDYRRAELNHDDLFLLRNRVYLGIRDAFDPLRFGFEFIDARQFASRFPEDDGDTDAADVLQAFAELYFKEALGPGQPVRFQAGRMSVDYVDRRLIGRNRWRNTINAFDGFRLQLGEPASLWQLDFFAWMPVERRLSRPDVPDEQRWLYGLAGAWRGWGKALTLEPYYFVLDEDHPDRARPDRTIHTLGLRGFGLIGETGFDYDFDAAFQFGDDGALKQRAYALYGELGYTFTHAWKPRLSGSLAYATGDRNPDDSISERFDRLYALNHCYQFLDTIAWQNMISPRMRLELKPHPKLKLDADYAVYWLAADSDAWVVSGRRDRTGRSGDFIGQGLETRVRYQLLKQAELEIGYAYFLPGDFVENTGPADDSDFLYVMLTWTF